MEFRQLKTENWMRHGGMQEIDFPTGDANIVVFFGENMNGKTSILNALFVGVCLVKFLIALASALRIMI